MSVAFFVTKNQQCPQGTEVLKVRPVIGTGTVNLEQAKAAFMLRCRAMSLSPGTIGWYDACLNPFLAFLGATGQHTPYVEPGLIRTYLDQLALKGTGKGTIARTFGALRCFYAYLSRERLIPQNPIQFIERPRKETRLIEHLSLEEIELLLKGQNRKRYTGLRCWTAMVLMLDTGLRASEVCDLKVSQMDWNAQIFRIIGKGDKERQIPFGSSCKQALWALLQRRGEVPGQDALFVNRYGFSIDRISLLQAVHRAGIRAGIKRNVHPHMLRHTFATRYLMNGGDVRSLQAILGHTTTDMVMEYLKLASHEVQLQHRKFSPMDRMDINLGLRRKVLIK